jgi:hypothetical protein
MNPIAIYLRRIRFDITGKDGSVYLRRYRLVSCRWLRIYLHHIRRDDEDRALHDHPWGFFSIILAGGYYEVTASGTRWYEPGRILWRPAIWTHRLMVPQPAWTLVVAGPRVRDWGFHTNRGWCWWKNYIAGACRE